MTGRRQKGKTILCVSRSPEPAGYDGDAHGGRQPHPPRHVGPGEPGGGADLPAALEGPERLRPTERPGPALLPAPGKRRHDPQRDPSHAGRPPPRHRKPVKEGFIFYELKILIYSAYKKYV